MSTNILFCFRNAKRKKISDLTPREQRTKRKCWRRWDSTRRNNLKRSNVLTPPSFPLLGATPSGDVRRGRKVMLRNRAKCYRENVKLREKNHTNECKTSSGKKEDLEVDKEVAERTTKENN